MKEELRRLQSIKDFIRESIEKHNYLVDEEEALVKTRNILINFLRDEALSVSKLNKIDPRLMRGMIAELMCEFLFKFYLRENNLDKDNYVSNVMITKPDGSTTQLDAVCRINNTIFVIECKSLYGPLVFSNGEIKTKTIKMVPWKQNEGHIKALKHAVGDYKYVNVIYLFGLGIVKEDSRIGEHIIVNNGGLETIRKLSNSVNFQNPDIPNDFMNKIRQMRPTVDEENAHIEGLKKIRELITSN